MSVTSEDISRVLKAVPTELLIGGEQVAGENTLDVEDPSTTNVLTSSRPMPRARRHMAALDAADQGLSWAQAVPRTEGDPPPAYTLLPNGPGRPRPADDAGDGQAFDRVSGEVAYGAEFFPLVLEEAVRIAGGYAIAPSGGTRLLTMKQPVGPVYAITLEFSVGHGHPEARPGGGGRLHGR